MTQRLSPRLRRLRNDHAALLRLKSESSILDFQSAGDPPDHYLLTFRGRGLYRPDNTHRIAVVTEHKVSITLGASYPRLMPELAWRSPIFHPNISGSGVVCLGGYGTYWVPSLNLDELCEMLWDMIRYANFDVDSPYNREAANWARLQTDFQFPIDARPMRDRVAAGLVKPVDLAPAQPRPLHPHAQPIPVPANSNGDDIVFIDDKPGEIVEAEIVDGEDDVLVIE
jgi:ubiquitin-protein ligase